MIVQALPTKVWLSMCAQHGLDAMSACRSLGWADLGAGTREEWEGGGSRREGGRTCDVGHGGANEILGREVGIHPMVTLLGFTPPRPLIYAAHP